MPARDVLLEQWNQTIPLLSTPATTGKAPGVNVEEDWQSTIATLNEAGLLKTAKAPSEYWDSSFAPRGDQ
jgi:NitT/TauT family transport system substrate-binding protein